MSPGLSALRARLASDLAHIRSEFNVDEIGIFGSYVRGEETDTSDVDILVTFARPVGMFKFIALEEHLAALLGVKVDLVSKKALKPYIGARILDEAVMV